MTFRHCRRGPRFRRAVDGEYEIAVGDAAGKSGTPAASTIWRSPSEADFALRIAAPKWSVPLGGKTDLAVKAFRTGGFKGPIAIALRGLPEA